ncbi:Ion channel [Mucilaginibacter pineti]|uniref:Ion channel n=1 Tax=Mucilaginibacter pineti TaxID=1391627 RepID=A0A1G7G9X9_9SPHI|nr:potassium channel family protein [Mucilaginibacter pineti]SDE84903.1 Ion channel [Mucilaginibacter pineti]
MKTGNQFELPKERSKSFLELIDALSNRAIIGWGALLYAGPVLLISVAEYFIGGKTHIVTTQADVTFWDLIYFNFVSMLTIGYGDMSPSGIFRFFTILEAITGLAIYTCSISLITIKLLLPKKNIIVFSKYAYYCLDDEAFMIIYLNTANQFLTNLETSWYFKLDEDWDTRSPVRVPFITKSVQTFQLHFDKTFQDINATLHPYDCLRIGLSADIGMASYSTYVEYGVEEILVISNRTALTAYEGFYKVDEQLQTEKFANFFHYCPEGASRLSECLKSAMNKHRKNS